MAKQIASENRKPLIDATPKKDLTVAEPAEVSEEDFQKELARLEESIERIRAQYFSSSAALMRIRERNFYDLIKAHLYVLQNKREEQKKLPLKEKQD